MKVVIFIISFLVCAFAFEGVAKGDITIKVNNHIKILKNGDVLKLKEGDKICYIKGDGEFIIDKKIVIDQFSANYCPVLKKQKSKSVNIFYSIIALFINDNDTKVNGISVRSAYININLKNRKFIQINSKVPLLIKIFLPNKVIIKIIKKGNSLIKIPKNTYKIEIYKNKKIYLILK